jgi:hypothetical protein
MITIEKINIYKYFNGNIDSWARVGTKEQKAIMNDKDWLLIDDLIQDIRLLEKALVSEIYMKTINERLNENCDSEETISELKKMTVS